MRLELSSKKLDGNPFFSTRKVILFSTILFISITIGYFIIPQILENPSSNEEDIVFPLLSEITVESEETLEEAFPNEYEVKLLDDWLPLIPSALDETEWIIVVDRSEQKDYVFQNRKFVKSYIVSTGSATRYEYDATLPLGVWRVGTKYDYSLGEIYGPRLMYLEIWRGSFFEKTLKALHGTNEPENLGQATSMGCVYHSNEDIIELFDLIPEGTLVITVE